MRIDVWFFSRVGYTDCIGSGFRGFKRFRYSECDELAVVANHIIFERRSSLFTDARESWPGNGPIDLADISAMKDGMHARHLFSRRCIKLRDPSIGYRRPDRYSIKHSWKVKVGGVLCQSRDLAWAIHSNCIASNDGTIWWCLLCRHALLLSRVDLTVGRRL